MNIEQRTQILINKTLNLDDQLGRSAASLSQNYGERARIITDQPATWKALIAPGYSSYSSEDLEDPQFNGGCMLFQLWVYQQLQVAAHARADQIAVPSTNLGHGKQSSF